MDRYFAINMLSGFTAEQVSGLAMHDYAVISAPALSDYVSSGDLIRRIRTRNGNCKVLLYIDLPWAPITGSDSPLSYQGLNTQVYPDCKPHDVVSFQRGLRCHTQNQFIKTITGSTVTGGEVGTGWRLIDYTDYCPRGTDNLTFRQWFASYLTTGICKSYDIDGFFFNNLSDTLVDGLSSTAVDINRDGSADSSASKNQFWSAGMSGFVGDLRRRLNAEGFTDHKIFYKGDFTGYSYVNGQMIRLTRSEGTQTARASSYIWTTGYAETLLATGVTPVFYQVETGIDVTKTNFDLLTLTEKNRINYLASVAFQVPTSMYCVISHTPFRSTNSVYFSTSSFAKLENPLTQTLTYSSLFYRLYAEGICVVNTTNTGSYFEGLSIGGTGGGLIRYLDPKRDFYTHTDALGHGFFGVKGSGVAQHLNHPDSVITVEMMNRHELALDNMKEMILPNTGPWVFDPGKPVMQYFYTTGGQKEFDLRSGVYKWDLDGYDWVGFSGASVNPIFLNPNLGRLTKINPNSRMYYGLKFETAPPSGYFFLFYTRRNGPSVNSSAYLRGTGAWT